ncbi:TolC family protein [Blastopirellula sp. J2-11]|uniref:TolC family protein n=1 Tax=Blastopirellula sp. J2-11 TaxID=2943192 RepID=UPI0021CA03E2|nr:TolC family protein [Blastopirellula sp. J2-11]
MNPKSLATIGKLATCAALSTLFCWASTGCNRYGYVANADAEAQSLVAQKSNNPRWAIDNFNIDVNPRSRYYDTYDPVKPPMPPDDPYSHRYMHMVDNKKGWSHWGRNGIRPILENPRWLEELYQHSDVTEQGEIMLDLDDSVRLAILQSPDYQQQLETIYLSSLDVSTERFRFDVQFFGGNFTQFEHLGQERAGGESSKLRLDNGLEMNRKFATAGEFLVGIANSTIWEFAGPNRGVTTSILNFGLVQPILRAGGRVIALEQLTIAERTLLANLRAYAQYRQGFYTQVAFGELGVAGPQRRGGFFGGTGLTGFTGQGSGGFGGVGDATGFGRGFNANGAGGAGASGSGFAGGGAGTVGGFLGLLQQLQQIRNTQDSLSAQERTLDLLEANLDAGLIDIAQVDQFRQNIETERANLLQAHNNLETALDTFKRSTLGLPPNLPIALNDELIQKFKLTDPATTQTQVAIEEYISRFGDLPHIPTLEDLQMSIEDVDSLQHEVDTRVGEIPADLQKLESVTPARTLEMTESERGLFERDKDRLIEEVDDLESRNDLNRENVEKLASQIGMVEPNVVADQLVARLVEMKNLVSELGLIEARARIEQINIQRVYLTPEQALEIARANRLDWMNNRASLVDTWRLIEYNANALKSNLTIAFSGDLQTLGENPAQFRSQTGSLRASVQFDPPLTRLVERNSFRQQLIEYQQDRRDLIQFDDSVFADLRASLRTLEQLRLNLEIQRRAVVIAIRRVDQTREALSAPVAPAEPGQPALSLGPTAAQNLLFALSDLRNTQNNLMSVWLNYEANRMRLYRQLGIMQIDHEGIWVDTPLDLRPPDASEEIELPPAVPMEWLQEGYFDLPEEAEVEETESTDLAQPESADPPLWRVDRWLARLLPHEKENVAAQPVPSSYSDQVATANPQESRPNQTLVAPLPEAYEIEVSRERRYTNSEIQQMLQEMRARKEGEQAAAPLFPPENG